MANSVDPDKTAPIGAVGSGPTLFASTLNSSVMLGNYLQQTTSADDIFRCIFFLALLYSVVCLPSRFVCQMSPWLPDMPQSGLRLVNYSLLTVIQYVYKHVKALFCIFRV